MRETFRGLLRVLEDVVEREDCTAAIGLLKLGFECSTGKEFNREKLSIPGGLHCVNRGDVWMIEGREGIRFLEKALEMGTGGVYLRRKELQRDPSVQLLIQGFVYDTHSAFAQFGLDLVVQKPLGPSKRRPVGQSCDTVQRVAGGISIREHPRLELHGLPRSSE